jgi:hypothetical protein
MSEHGQVIHLPVRNATAPQSAADQNATVSYLAARRKPVSVSQPRTFGAATRTPLMSVPNPSSRPPTKRVTRDPVGRLYISGLFQEVVTFPGISQNYKLFAAPSDLLKTSPHKRDERLQKNFDDALKYLATLDNYHGHKGFDHNVSGLTPQQALYQSLKDETYKGEWALPTDEILAVFYKNRHRGEMMGTFAETSNGIDTSHIYASCTSENSEFAKVMNFADGNISWNKKDAGTTSLRLFRLEPCL